MHYFHTHVGLVQLHKEHAETRYTELVFFHPMGSAGHVAHSGASGARSGYALFFKLGWDRYRFNKKRDGHCLFRLFTHSSTLQDQLHLLKIIING
jgi:hypothetical protein